jgi:hypothetical protein
MMLNDQMIWGYPILGNPQIKTIRVFWGTGTEDGGGQLPIVRIPEGTLW